MPGPPELVYGDLRLRGLRRRDAGAWLETRLRNEGWLAPWEATPLTRQPAQWAERHTLAGYGQLLRTHRAQQRAGTHLTWAVVLAGDLVGQVTVGSIVRSAFNSGYLGYWVDRAVAGRGVAPTAVALVCDAVFAGGLHRVEANIRPENAASLRVAEKVGMTSEGRRRRYLAIDGDYRDHLGFVLLSEDLPGGVLSALVANGDALRP